MTGVVLLSLLAVLTVASVIAGVVVMGRSGSLNRKYGNILMRVRIVLHVLLILVFLGLLLLWED